MIQTSGKILLLLTPGGPLTLVGCPHHPLPPHHLPHGCPATWLLHLLLIAMAAKDGVISNSQPVQGYLEKTSPSVTRDLLETTLTPRNQLVHKYVI